MEKILSYEKRVSYDKDENVNIVLNNDSYWTDDCCVSCCSIFSSICCISCCICCRADSKSKISDIFDYRVVMSTNFKNEIVFDLIKHYKQKLDNLVSETKDNEWQLNELTSKLDNKDGILFIINQNKEELESKLESEPLNVLKDLSDIYKKEKMNKQMSSDLENRINILNEKNISNKRETYICREKINELYKYAAMCNLVE